MLKWQWKWKWKCPSTTHPCQHLPESETTFLALTLVTVLLQNLFKDMKRKLPTFQTIWCSSISQPCHRLLILMVLQNTINQPTLSSSLHYWMLNLMFLGGSWKHNKRYLTIWQYKKYVKLKWKTRMFEQFWAMIFNMAILDFLLRLANKCKFWKIRTNSGQFRQSWLILILLVLEFFWLIFGVDGFGNWRICPKPVPWHPDIFILVLAASNTI